MNAIIFYEHLVREWAAVKSLKQELEAKGFRVKAYSLIFQRTAAWFDSIFHRPDVIYLPWYNLEIHEKILDPFYRLSPNVIIINQHQEQISSPTSSVALFPKTEATKNGCYHFAWGDFFKELLIDQGVKEELIYVTGNIRNDAGKDSVATKEALAKEFGLDVNKKWILFAENRGWLAQRNTDGTIKEMLRVGLSMDHINDHIAYTKTSLDALFTDINSLGEEFAAKYEFIYRPHPGTQFDIELPSYAHVLSNRPIYDWIINCDLFLTCESTSIFEAEMCGVPCATVHHIDVKESERMAGVHDYPKLSTLKVINDEFISELALAQKQREPIYKRYFGYVDGCSCKRTVEATMEILKKPAPHGFPMCKSTVYDNLRYFTYETLTFIITKLGLMKKLRFPRTAYTEARDIPYSSENDWIKD